MNKNSGIYTITSPSGKCYVGQTINFYKRWWLHKNQLKNNKHFNIILQNAYNKYGIDKLKFEIVTLCEHHQLNICEQAWMDILAPEYNISPTAGNSLGIRRSQEFKDKISRSSTGRKHSTEAKTKVSPANIGKHLTNEHKQKIRISKLGGKNPKARSIYCVDHDKVFDSVVEASLWLESKLHRKIHATIICRALRGKIFSAYNLQWEYIT